MADWTNIPDASVDPDAPVTSDLMYALRDNPIAIAEGATGAPRLRISGAFDGAAPAAGAGVLVVPSFSMGLPANFKPFSDETVVYPTEENFFFMTVGAGELRLQSGTVSLSGGSGSLEVYIGNTLQTSVGSGSSLNTVISYSINQLIRFRCWRSERAQSISAPNIQIRTTRHGICLLPFKWGYGLP